MAARRVRAATESGVPVDSSVTPGAVGVSRQLFGKADLDTSREHDPGEACASLAEARAGIRAALAGDYGRLLPAASLVAVTVDQQLAGAIQIVECAPWPDTPDCPFAIELATARAHRRRGISRGLLVAALQVLAQAGPPRLALRVSAGNDSALRLYRSLGFREWTAWVRQPSQTAYLGIRRSGG